MNKQNVQKAIDIMRRVKERGDGLCMNEWSNKIEMHERSEQKYHDCGTAACLAGWIASSDEWRRDGGDVSVFGGGAPSMQKMYGAESISNWLDITDSVANGLCAIGHNYRMARVTKSLTLCP